MIQSKNISLPRAIASFLLTRFSLDTALRSPIPYLSLIAAAYKQDASGVGWLAVALTLAGLAAPITGVLGQRFGQRTMIFAPLLLFVAACAFMPLAPSFAVVLVLCVVLSIAKAMFDPQMQAFIGEQVPYEKRGTVIGIIEFSWALSWVIGVPVFAFLADGVAWWAPFLLMGFVALLGVAALWRNARRAMPTAKSSAPFSFVEWRQVLANPRARLFFLFGLGITCAAQMPLLVYPEWFRTRFGLSTVQLGIASTVVGAADFLAELLVVFLVDRIGKRKATLGCCVFYALACLTLWLFSNTQTTLLVALFLVTFGFEFTLVASLSIASEMMPNMRTTFMGFFGTANTAGRIIGSLVALPLFGTDQRLWLISVACCVCVGVALWAGWRATAAPKIARL